MGPDVSPDHRRHAIHWEADLVQNASYLFKMLPVLCAWLLAARLAPADTTSTTQPASDLLDPPRGAFVDEWYAVLMAGQKCGQMHSRMDRIRSSRGDLIVTQTKMRIRLQRAGIQVEVSTYNKTTETLDGHPLSFVRKTYLGQQPITTEGTVRDGRVTVTTSQLGQKLPPRTYPLPKGAMMDWAVFKEQLRRGFEAGTRYTLPLYEPSISPDRLCPTDIEILGPETVDLFGRKVEAVKTRQVMHIPKGAEANIEQETISWVTPDGQIVKLRMEVLDIPVEVIACPKSIAMSPDQPAELMHDLVIPIHRSLDADRLHKVTYRIRFTGDPDHSPLAGIPETPVQKILRHSNREAIIQVTRPSALARKSATPDVLTGEQRARYLQASPILNYRDPKVAELVSQAARDEKDPRRLARLLVDFVERYIRRKSFNVGFATASEVARSREGDCTEHGVLLAAMGRAKGIPTRLVTGLVYTDYFAGRRNVLAGHLWTQFWIDGRWVDLDATRGQTDLDPTHLALSIHAADDAGFADLIASTWLSIPKLQVEVLAVEPE